MCIRMPKKSGCLAVALFLLSPSSFAADASTTAYLAARDKAVAAVQREAKHEPIDALELRSQHALEGLQSMLRNIIGPIRIQGFPTEGTIHLETLIDELGYGKLDGLFVKSFDGNMQAVVSSVPLLHDWLGRHQDSGVSHSGHLPIDMASAFMTEGFYMEAFEDDAYYYKFADLPVVAHHTGGIARAILFEHTQDTPAPYPPDGIAVSVVVDDRVFILKESTAVREIPACKTAYEKDRDLAEVALRAYHASQLKDKAQFQKYTDLDDAASSNFQRCFQHHLAEQHYFPALVRQAQGLIDRIDEGHR
jgi:hypothetical protein